MTTATQELIWQVVVVVMVASIAIVHVAAKGWIDSRITRRKARVQ